MRLGSPPEWLGGGVNYTWNGLMDYSWRKPGFWHVEHMDGETGEWKPLKGSAGYWLHVVGFVAATRLYDPRSVVRLVDKWGEPREPIRPGDQFPDERKKSRKG